MAYSEEVKKEVLKRIAKGEKIKDINVDTGISVPTLYHWKNSEEFIKVKKFQKAKEASKEIKELKKQGRLDEALEICEKEEFKDDEAIQSQRVNILIKKGDEKSLEDALDICEKNLEDERVSLKQKEIFKKQYVLVASKKVSILIGKGDEQSLDKALEICEKEEFKDDEVIQRQKKYVQSKRVDILIKNGDEKSLDEALEICEKEEFKDHEAMQSQRVSILIKKGDEKSLDEALEICEKEESKDNEVIQSQRANILIKRGDEQSLDKALEICEKEEFKDNEIIQAQKKYVELLLARKLRKKPDESRLEEELDRYEENAVVELEKSELAEQLLKAQTTEQNTNNKERKFLNSIKTKLYYNDVSIEFIEEIKQNNTELTEWEKTVALLAIYNKQRNTKTAEQMLKAAKKSFKEEPEKIKTLNKLQNVILSKRPRIFDWSIFDEVLQWNLEQDTHEEINAKREKEKAEKTKKQEKIEQEIMAQKVKRKTKTVVPKKVITVVPQKQDMQERQIKSENKPKATKKGKIPKVVSSSNHKPKEQAIRQMFENELVTLKVNILLEESRIDYEDSQLHVPANAGKGYKVPPEALQKLTQKCEKRKLLIKDLDAIEILTEKPISDVRAKMHMVLLLNKYGMRNVAYEKFGKEAKVFDELKHEFSEIDKNMDMEKEKEKEL